MLVGSGQVAVPAGQHQGRPSLSSRHFHTKEEEEIRSLGTMMGEERCWRRGSPKIVCSQPTSLPLTHS